jgi:hypothetical protein
MTSAAAAARGRAAYRQLLRAVDKHITRVGGNSLWREAVRDRFRSGAAPDAAATTDVAVRRAEDLAFLINSVNDHKARAHSATARTHARTTAASSCAFTACHCAPCCGYLCVCTHLHTCAHTSDVSAGEQELLISYGISTDKEAQTRDRVKHTAKRVGLLVRDEDWSFKPDEGAKQPPAGPASGK